MVKPTLPISVEAKLPTMIVTMIYRYVPHFKQSKPVSPSLQRALEQLQKSPKRSSMDLYGLDDFVLS